MVKGGQWNRGTREKKKVFVEGVFVVSFSLCLCRCVLKKKKNRKKARKDPVGWRVFFGFRFGALFEGEEKQRRRSILKGSTVVELLISFGKMDIDLQEGGGDREVFFFFFFLIGSKKRQSLLTDRSQRRS